MVNLFEPSQYNTRTRTQSKALQRAETDVSAPFVPPTVVPVASPSTVGESSPVEDEAPTPEPPQPSIAPESGTDAAPAVDGQTLPSEPGQFLDTTATPVHGSEIPLSTVTNRRAKRSKVGKARAAPARKRAQKSKPARVDDAVQPSLGANATNKPNS